MSFFFLAALSVPASDSRLLATASSSKSCLKVTLTPPLLEVTDVNVCTKPLLKYIFLLSYPSDVGLGLAGEPEDVVAEQRDFVTYVVGAHFGSKFLFLPSIVSYLFL